MMAPSRVAQSDANGGVEKEKGKGEASYESDSYENHVTDIRGLH